MEVQTILVYVVFCLVFYLEEIFSKSRATAEYCPDIIWTICLKSFQLGLWNSEDRLWWVFRYCFLSLDLDFLEPMLYSLGRCCHGGCLLNSSFLPGTHHYHYWWFLLDVEGNKRFLSLHYKDSGSWSLRTVLWRLAFNTQMTWILTLSVLLIHLRRIIRCLILSPL